MLRKQLDQITEQYQLREPIALIMKFFGPSADARGSRSPGAYLAVKRSIPSFPWRAGYSACDPCKPACDACAQAN